MFFFDRVRPRISVDIIAILTHILRQMPENASIVDDSVHSEFSSGKCVLIYSPSNGQLL